MSVNGRIEQMVKEFGFFQLHDEKECFYRYENGEYHVVKLISDIQDSIYTMSGLEQTAKSCMDMFGGISRDNVLILYLTDKAHAIKKYGVVYINTAKEKVSGSAPRYFINMRNRLNMLFKADKYMNKMYDVKFNVNRGHGVWAVMILILANILVASKYGLYLNFTKYGISYTDVVCKHETYRLFTYMFFHNGIRHVFFNMLSLWYIGRSLGQRTNGFSVFAVYVFGGLTAAATSMEWNNYIGLPERWTVGASGAIFALLGALLVCIIRSPEERHNWTAIVRYIVVTLACSALNLSVDNACHIGGLVGGIFIMTVFSLIGSAIRDVRYVHLSHKVREADVSVTHD